MQSTLEHGGSVGTRKPRSCTRKLWQKSVRKHVEIPPCDYIPVIGEKAVRSSQFHVPHLLQHGQPQSGAKAKVTLVSLGLSFNNLMFLPLRQVMKTSIPGTKDCSMILQKDKSRLARRNFIFLAMVSYIITVRVSRFWKMGIEKWEQRKN